MVSEKQRPGWPEIAVGLGAYAVLYVVVALILRHTDFAPAVAGVLEFAFSALMGIGAFAAAAGLRIRRLAPFGVSRRIKPRWLAAGAGLGVVAYVLSIGVSLLFMTLTGDRQNVQVDYQSAAAGGVLWYAATAVTGFVLTPIGEELIFRGVLANALGRYSAWISVLVSAAVFALAHGLNPVLPVAFVVGIMTALLFRRTGSIWPGVLVHGMNNALAITVPVIVTLASAP